METFNTHRFSHRLVSILVKKKIKYSIDLTIILLISDLDYINMVYKASYCRIGPYCIGILMAYIYHRRHFYHQQEYLINNNDNGDDDDDDQNNQIKNNRSTATGSMLLVISIILMFATTMLTYPWLQGADYINALSILYGAIHRCIWAIAWALFIWAMARQHLPLVDRLFSLPMFQVFSRLTYQSYLLHSVLISAIITSVRQKIYFSELNLVSFYFYEITIIEFDMNIFFFLSFHRY